MRVAFLNKGRQDPGGDLVALDATMDALRKRGVECEETGWDTERIKAGNFDLCHVFHCNFSWSLGNYEAVRDAGKQYVLTPVYYPGPLLCGITEDDLMEIIGNAAVVLPFSKVELGFIEMMRWGGHRPLPPVKIIPNGTDRTFHSRPVNLPPKGGVMCVSARGDSDKNVGMVQSICERIGARFTLATGVSREDLPGMYQSHKVFVNASGSERMSLTIGEALCSGCHVLATDQNWGNEWYPGLVTFDHRNETQLEHLIRMALYSYEWDYRPNAAARVLSWDWVASKIEDVYRESITC